MDWLSPEIPHCSEHQQSFYVVNPESNFGKFKCRYVDMFLTDCKLFYMDYSFVISLNSF